MAAYKIARRRVESTARERLQAKKILLSISVTSGGISYSGSTHHNPTENERTADFSSVSHHLAAPAPSFLSIIPASTTVAASPIESRRTGALDALACSHAHGLGLASEFSSEHGAFYAVAA